MNASRAEILVVLGLTLLIGFWLGYSAGTPVVVQPQDTHTETVDAGRPLAPKDTAVSRGANRLPEREVRYERVTDTVRVATVVPREVTRTDTVFVQDSTGYRPVVTQVPDFDVLPRTPGAVDLTHERLRLTLFDPDTQRYVQRFYEVPQTAPPAFSAGLAADLRYTALFSLAETDLPGYQVVRADILTVGLTGSVRYRRLGLSVRPFVDVIGLRPGGTLSATYKIL